MTSVWHPGSGTPPPRDDAPQPTTGEHIDALLKSGLDRYDLSRLLGVGGMGEVYLGVHRTIEKEVAIKVLAYEHRQNPQFNDRFLDEAKAASKIRHENIVDITDFGHSPQGCAYFVMEYLEGEDLSRTLSRAGRLPWERTQHLLVQLLDALQAAHDHGVVHRDVKPANCVRVTRGRDPDFLKVLDFGIARISERAEGEPSERLTKSGTIMGTAEYMAPEQARGDDVDHRTDLYAVGVMLFEMLTGQLPFGGRAPVETLSKHLFQPPPVPSEVAPSAGITPELDALVSRALAKEPGERFQSARQMQQAIEAVELRDHELNPSTGATLLAVPGEPKAGPTAPGESGELATTSPDWLAATGPGRRILRPIAAGGLVLAVAAAAWWWSGPGDRSPCPDGMVLVEGGAFFIGSDDEAATVLQSARPSHKVELSSFCIGTHEVTMDQFHACSDQGQCRRPYKNSRWSEDQGKEDPDRVALSTQCNERYPDRGSHPVNCVTWEQARDYCAFRGQRLPTEAEWEFSARGSDGRVFPWGDAVPTATHANLCNAECERWRTQHGLSDEHLYDEDDGYSGTAPVGSFPAGVTQHGLHDIVGNVFEWTATEFALYEGHPTGQSDHEGYVIRGGAHNSAMATFSDPALRFAMPGQFHTHALGLRCAADPAE